MAMAHGYAKAAGRPMAVLAHGTVGLQHAAMAVYNAWSDRAPVMIMAGNLLDATKRRAGVEWSISCPVSSRRWPCGLSPASPSAAILPSSPSPM